MCAFVHEYRIRYKYSEHCDHQLQIIFLIYKELVECALN